LPLIQTNTLLPLEQPEVSEESETLDFGKCGTANVETGFSRSSKLASRPKRSLESTTSLQSSPSTEETTTTDNNTDGGDSDEDDANNNNRRNESNENIKNVPKKTEQQKGRSTQQDSNAHVAEDANCYSTGTILHFPKSIAWDWPFCSEGIGKYSI
jgi:hypothetical protein